MTKFHVAVIGSRPEKGENNRYLPVPQENVDFISNVLSNPKIKAEDYAALYNGGDAIGEIAKEWAYNNHVHTRDFPAYWFDPTKQNNRDNAAGYKRNEAMVRALQDAIYNKEDEFAVLLVFHNTVEAKDDDTVKAVLEFAEKYGKDVNVKTIALPVKVSTATAGADTSNTVPF